MRQRCSAAIRFIQARRDVTLDYVTFCASLTSQEHIKKIIMAHISNISNQPVGAIGDDHHVAADTGNAGGVKAGGPMYVTLDEYLKQVEGKPVGDLKISVGAGPRGAAGAMGEIKMLEEREGDFQRLQQKGARYNIQTVLIESRKAEDVTRGAAWGTDQGYGTVNTTPEAALDHKTRLASLYKDNKDAILADYTKNNPVAAATFKSAFEKPEGTIDDPTVKRGAITRRDQGAEELQYFNNLAQSAREKFPFYKLTVIPETSVDKVDISKPNEPRVLVKANNSTAPHFLKASAVTLNVGTPLKSPISDKNVAELTFSEGMDPAKIAAFAKKHDLLGADGLLKPGTKVGSGGTSLSQYDQLIGLNTIMKLVEPSEDGYKVTPEAIKKYQGAITVISNTPGKWVPPRHSNSADWTQKKAPLGTAAELHALTLHKDGRGVFSTWANLQVASVAHTLDISRAEVLQDGKTTEELLATQGKSTQEHVQKLAAASGLTGDKLEQAMKKATWTLEGARREAYLSSMLGLGMAVDIPAATRWMKSEAPLTFREFYLAERAQPAGVTAAAVASKEDNRPQMAELNRATQDVIASPWRVHLMAVDLVKSGIMKYVEGSYNDLKANPGDKQITFQGRHAEQEQKLDAFFVSQTFDRKASGVLNSLEGQVKPVDPQVPSLPATLPNRLLANQQGQVVQVQDNSINGTGARHPVTGSTIGLVAYDVNNRDSSYDIAPAQALRRLSHSHLLAAGLEAPDTIKKLYEKHSFVSEEAFNKEVQKFSGHFTSAKDKEAFVMAIDKVVNEDSGGASKSALMKRFQMDALTEPFVRTESGRWAAALVGQHMAQNPGASPTQFEQAFVKTTGEFAKARGAVGAGSMELAGLEKFSPTTKEEYFARFIDYPMEVHEAVYKDALKMAEDKLDSNARQATRNTLPALRRKPGTDNLRGAGTTQPAAAGNSGTEPTLRRRAGRDNLRG